MISVTQAAAQQIREAARQGKVEGMALRVAASRREDGSLQYILGFDDTGAHDDPSFESHGVKLVVAAESQPLLEGTTIDYVKLDSGEMGFVFLNPNDPHYRPAADGGAP